MYPAGYYQTNYRALRFREVVRMTSLPQAFTAFVHTRFQRPGHGFWMPGFWAEMECRQEDLSEYMWQATKPHRLDFERLGFTICRYLKATKSLDPKIQDSNGVNFLDPTRRFFAQLLYQRVLVPATGTLQNTIIIAFTAVFEDGCVSCTNNKAAFDPPANDLVIRLSSWDVNFIHQRFLTEIQRRADPPREFPTLDSLRRWFDERQACVFEERVRRRLFVPMTEREVETAKNRLAGYPTSDAAGPPRATRTAMVWLILIVALMVLWSLHPAPRAMSDTVTYRGQQFKMAKPYASYEDYKDDPNNLDTNELDRIEQVMTATRIPASFKDRKAFIHVLIFELAFPGYGFGGLSGTCKTDDGSTLDVEEIEIPQRDKARYLVVRESPGEWELLDDFVAGTATNAITNVKLESRTLLYYNAHGDIVRQRRL